MEFGADQTSRVHWDGRTLTVIQQRVRPVLDDSWTFTDAAGHEHIYGNVDVPFPTLIRVSDGWSEDSENPDDNSEIERYHLACAQCEERIWPSSPGPVSEYGPRTFFYWIDDKPVTQRAAREFTNNIRVNDPERWERMYGWLKYSAGLIQHATRSVRT